MLQRVNTSTLMPIAHRSTELTISRPRKLVVAGLIVAADRPCQVLLTQRRADQSFALDWEFPGGKVEAGESPQIALRRELTEEIGIDANIGRIWDTLFHKHDNFDLLMLVYQCRILSGTPAKVAVADVRWVDLTDLLALGVMAADEPLVARLTLEGIPPWK
jgi:8-oxo-dGTP diphosphatase